YFNQPTAVVAAKPPEVTTVLVANRNIFAGHMIDTTWVTIRPLRPEEVKHYEQNRDQYLPPVQNAATLRIAAKNIEADKPILKDRLAEMAPPEPLSMRLLPNMRAVNLTITKDQSAGGLIQVGEWVDVLFTTQISVNGAATTRTAAIAHKQRVIAKRNTTFP